MEQGLDNDFSLLPEYAKILQSIIQLDENLQKKTSENQQKCVNDVFSVIEKAYWTLYLQENDDKLSEQQKKQIYFNLSSKIGKSLDSQLSKTILQNNKLPKWFIYKGYAKKQHRDENSNRQNSQGIYGERQSKSQWGLKNEHSLKMQERQGTTVDPYHAKIKSEAQNGLPEIEVIYRFFSIKSMLVNSTDMMDIQKITIIHRRGNSFDRQDQGEVERQKNKFRQKFRLYSELIRCFQYFGYGARIAKKHSKQKVTGTVYQYAVVHISKITFKLLEKYVMNFINKKTRYTHRARLEKITYNMFNLPDFFTPELKIVFIRLLKIVFEVEEPLPFVTKNQLKELYDYLLKQMLQKQKNPDKFKNQYMIKLQNPTFYNVRKQIRQQVKQQAQEKKRLGIRTKGRKSKASQQLNDLKKSLAEEQQFFQMKRKGLNKQLYGKHEKIQYVHKKKDKKVKKQEHFSQNQSDQEQDQEQMANQIDYSQDQQVNHHYDSDQQSEEIRDYFRKSNMSKRSSSSKKKSKNKKERTKSKRKEHKRDSKSRIYSESQDD